MGARNTIIVTQKSFWTKPSPHVQSVFPQNQDRYLSSPILSYLQTHIHIHSLSLLFSSLFLSFIIQPLPIITDHNNGGQRLARPYILVDLSLPQSFVDFFLDLPLVPSISSPPKPWELFLMQHKPQRCPVGPVSFLANDFFLIVDCNRTTAKIN